MKKTDVTRGTKATETRRASSLDKTIGRRIREARSLRGLTQGQLATKFGCSFQQVHKYELGINCITASKLHKIAQFLDVPIAFFFEEPSDCSFTSTDIRNAGYPDEQILLSPDDARRVVRVFSSIRDPKLRTTMLAVMKLLGD